MRLQNPGFFSCITVGLVAIIGASVGMAPETPEAPVVGEFPSYQKAGRHWRNVVIAPDPSIEALTALAQRLHAEDPKSSFWLFTDGNAQQFRRLMLWDLHSGKPDTARYPYPEAWANRHRIAMINEFVGRGTRGSAFCWKLQVNRGSSVKPPVAYGHTVDLERCR
jgi:hypothetical protein